MSAVDSQSDDRPGIEWQAEQAEQILEQTAKQLGYEVAAFPWTTAEIFAFLEASEYAFSRTRLDYLLNSQQLKSPARFGRTMKWDAMDVLRLIALLEGKRWWKSESELHTHKFNRYERGRLLAKQSGIFDNIASQTSKYTIRDYALMLLAAQSRDEKDRVFMALECCLEQLGVE